MIYERGQRQCVQSEAVKYSYQGMPQCSPVVYHHHRTTHNIQSLFALSRLGDYKLQKTALPWKQLLHQVGLTAPQAFRSIRKYVGCIAVYNDNMTVIFTRVPVFFSSDERVRRTFELQYKTYVSHGEQNTRNKEGFSSAIIMPIASISTWISVVKRLDK